MNHDKKAALAARRKALVAQLAIQRMDIALNSSPLRRLALVIDYLSPAVMFVKRHPQTLLLPAAIISIFRPWRLLAFAISGFRFLRKLQSVRHRILARLPESKLLL